MIIKEIGSRGVLFTFEQDDSPMPGDSVYLIRGEHRNYLCDTHLGSASMEYIQQYLRDNDLDDKDLVIFLSHSDWDHIWGAAAFRGAMIVAHEKCRKRIAERGAFELSRYGNFQQGEAILTLPGLTFDNRLEFQDDQVQFLFAPGHTPDCAVCIDRKDGIIYVGDLVETPEPSVAHHDVETYIETLETLKNLPGHTYVSSHSGLVTQEDINANIQALRDFFEEATSDPADGEKGLNHKYYLYLMYEEAIAQTMGDRFDYTAFQNDLWGSLELDPLELRSKLLKSVGFDALEDALQSYMADL